MDVQEEVAVVKKELVDLIIQHLQQNKIDIAQAQSLAKEFLAVLPVASQKELLEKLQKLGETYEEAKEVYVEEWAKVTDTHDDTVLNQMRDHIQSGNIEHAIAAAKSLQQQKG